ncbi:ORF6N domain-containing protein [Pseudomonas sp. GD03651]|uniref:ORF6N domain-containing protein n=1 Tax=unclassified Pseudomonas TaxID=196821 RepID=UPI001E643203|nr:MULTISPECIES: ORF6N domain-containing protein [unclassified Pseudomonas]MCE0964548.1 ORF6N domain-containing protein [Pseudomonas sp. NMI4491_12]MDH2184817.1 ORF6N domain-containing protein [Pseudomonas sp. GD03651]
MNLVTIHNTQLPIVEYRGQRVVTLAMIDQVHERPDDTAGRNFREHRDRFIVGSDYYVIARSENSEIRGLGFDVPNRGLIALTEQGYLMLVKSLTDDLAWTVQRQLVSNYFRPTPAPALPGDYITALEHLLASKRSEQLALEQRDQAIATKAEIGSRREATAMAKASAAVREAARLRDELGFSTRHATILKVEAATGRRFSFVNLRRWCKANGVTPEIVQDKRYADGVKAWPAAAWADVFDIDLAELFGAVGDQA